LREIGKLKKEIDSKFWTAARKKFNDLIESFEDRIQRLTEAVEEKENLIQKLKKEIKKADKIIDKNRSEITNIESSIKEINKKIQNLGVTGFKIVKAKDGENYKIYREDKDDEVFRSLSEGEKTLITFLYFLEYCKGSHGSYAPVNVENRVVVIDDPISSLSHNYVYDIASIIHHQIIKKEFKQVILLTHNLFFFHELLQQGRERNYKLFRLTKKDFSKISDMERDEIKNEYESYWQVIKDVLNAKASKVILPNVMRNILETYFSFIHQKDRLKEALDELESQDEPKFRPLYRYINRESHAGAINLTDFGEIDSERYISKFREVFDMTRNLEHYQKMIDAGLEEKETI
jgi:wobble nucleotide-excising tRNase